MLGARRIGAPGIAHRRQVIGQHPPRIGVIGLQVYDTPQRFDRRFALPVTAVGNRELVMCDRPVGVLAR